MNISFVFDRIWWKIFELVLQFLLVAGFEILAIIASFWNVFDLLKLKSTRLFCEICHLLHLSLTTEILKISKGFYLYIPKDTHTTWFRHSVSGFDLIILCLKIHHCQRMIFSIKSLLKKTQEIKIHYFQFLPHFMKPPTPLTHTHPYWLVDRYNHFWHASL